MGKNTSIVLGDHFENFIQSKISSGRYNSASEVIRTALRLLEIEEKRIQELVKSLETGENSEIIDNFNPDRNLKELHKKHL